MKNKYLQRLLHGHIRSFVYGVSLLLVMAVHIVSVQAHGDDDHGASAAKPAMTGEPSNRPWGASDNFEVVVVYTAIEPGTETVLDFYLSDFNTNIPVAGATVEITVSGSDISPLLAVAEPDSGLYYAKILFPDTGSFDLLFDITTADDADFVEVTGVHVGGSTVNGMQPEAANENSRNIIGFIVAGLLNVILAAGLTFRLNKKNRKSIQAALIIGAFLGMTQVKLHAHGGEDHEHPSNDASASSGQPGFLGKGAQFLLGVRTTPVEKESVTKQIQALGRVIEKPSSSANVFPSQSGRLVSLQDVRYPQVGDKVKKGQAIAAIQVLDAFIVYAPIDGVISGAFAIPGGNADPGRPLFTIQNLQTVWVEAFLQGGDVSQLGSTPSASISSSFSPGSVIESRFVGFAPEIEAGSNVLRARFELQNTGGLLRPGMPVDVHLTTSEKIEGFLVPRDAVMTWEGLDVIFVHIQPEIFARRTIRKLGAFGDKIAIEGEIKENDRIVVSGGYQLLNIPQLVSAGGR